MGLNLFHQFVLYTMRKLKLLFYSYILAKNSDCDSIEQPFGAVEGVEFLVRVDNFVYGYRMTKY